MLAVANVVTLGADLGGMADVTQMITGVSASVWPAVYPGLVAVLLLVIPYCRIERMFRWLCLVLFAYVAGGFLSRPDWDKVVANTLIPRMQWSREYLSTIVAILGATVSPYFLFWQASQEVETEYALGRKAVAQRRGASRSELKRSRRPQARYSALRSRLRNSFTYSDDLDSADEWASTTRDGDEMLIGHRRAGP